MNMAGDQSLAPGLPGSDPAYRPFRLPFRLVRPRFRRFR